MIVKELIEKLKKFNKNASVYIHFNNGILYEFNFKEDENKKSQNYGHIGINVNGDLLNHSNKGFAKFTNIE